MLLYYLRSTIFSFLKVLIILLFFLPLKGIASDEQNDINTLHVENSILKEKLQRLRYTNLVMESNIRDVSVSEIKSEEETAGYIEKFWFAFLGALFSILLLKNKEIISFLRKEKSEDLEVIQERRKIKKKLTDRELDVLLQLSEFKSNPEIAESLFISTNTAKTHVANILKKLKASNRQEAVYKAIRMKLIPEKVGELSIILFMVFFFCNTLTAQSFLKAQQVSLTNETACTFLVKVNLLDKASCQLTGSGPLVKLKAHSTVNLPELPPSSHVAAYGVEEVKSNSLNNAKIIGKMKCNFPGKVFEYGSCKAKLEYKADGLLVSANLKHE